MNRKKSLPIFGQKAELDPTGDGVIKGVVIIQEGIDKCGDFISEAFIDEIVKQGNGHGPGIKSRFGHPNMCADSLGDYIGRYKNFRKETNEDGRIVAVADLFLDPVGNKSPTKPGLFDYVKEMAAKNPDMFGNSIVFLATSEDKEMDVDGEMITVFELTLIQFLASDLVDSPAATDNLFKSTDLGMKITVFLDESGNDIFQALESNPSMLSDFLSRYTAYRERKLKTDNTMAKTAEFTKKEGRIKSVLTAVGEWFKSDRKEEPKIPAAEEEANTKGEYATQDGKKLTCEGELVPGSKVQVDGEDKPSAEIPMADGTTIVTDENSAITEIKPAAEVDGGAYEEGKSYSIEGKKMKSILEKVSNLEKANAKLEADKKDQGESLDALAEQVEFLGKSIASGHKPKPKQDSFNNPKGGESDMEKAIRLRREERSKKK